MMAGKRHLPTEGIGSRQNRRELYFLWNEVKCKSAIAAECNKLQNRNMQQGTIEPVQRYICFIYLFHYDKVC